MRLGFVCLLMLGACVGTPGPGLGDTQEAAGLRPFCVGRYDIGIPSAAIEPAPPSASGADFCVDGGIVHRGFEWQESTTLAFDLPGGTLIVEKVSNGRTTPDSLLDRAPGFLGSVMMDLDTLRSGRRDAGGHAGEELVMRAPDGGLFLMWGTPGAPLSGEEPNIRIQLELRGADPAATLAAWDAILSSFVRHRGS